MPDCQAHSIFGFCLFALPYRLLVIGPWLSAIGYWPLAIPQLRLCRPVFTSTAQ
jgi:hypothetical protein